MVASPEFQLQVMAIVYKDTTQKHDKQYKMQRKPPFPHEVPKHAYNIVLLS